MEEIKPYELQKFINVVYEAVHKSTIGPMYVANDDGGLKIGPDGQPVLKVLPYNVLLNLINAMAPRPNVNVTGTVVAEEKKGGV